METKKIQKRSRLGIIKRMKRVIRTRDHKKIPVIMVTTEGSHERVSEAIKSGVNDHILKPIEEGRLRDVLGKYLAIE
jgi:PleD family two-component response regulator